MAYSRGGKLCACGCGEQAKKSFNSNGRFKCYLKYADGHRPNGATPKQLLASIRMVGLNHPNAKPLMTKRIHISRGIPYYEIKINATGKWIYEHRYVMENKIGRKLMNDEIVHHINGNTLDNRVENLKLMTRSEHSVVHHKNIITHNHLCRKLPDGVWSMKFSKCIVCGLTTSPYATRGVCSRCNQFYLRNGFYKDAVSS